MSQIHATDEAVAKLDTVAGIELKRGQNPYAVLINECNSDASMIQAVYDAHRLRRNSEQRAKLLDDKFDGLTIDPYLLRLANPSTWPDFVDERNCIVLWARPPRHVLNLANVVQQRLKEVAPNAWFMPTDAMHLTAMELVHSCDEEHAAVAVASFRGALPGLVDFTFSHRTRLVKPLISHDVSGFALTFVPANGETPRSPAPVVPYPHARPLIAKGDGYTYHHLRRDLFDAVTAAGAEINPRYNMPSAHITLGRFISDIDHETPAMRQKWVDTIEEVNDWLQDKVWDRDDCPYIGEWVVGQERGLDCRVGAASFGGGRSVLAGEGF